MSLIITSQILVKSQQFVKNHGVMCQNLHYQACGESFIGLLNFSLGILTIKYINCSRFLVPNLKFVHILLSKTKKYRWHLLMKGQVSD